MQAGISNWRTDPYRILFPIGYCFLTLGLGVWSVDLLGGFPHKETLHALLLGNGFLYAFALGILLSESPRAVDAQPAQAGMIAFFCLCLAGMGVAGLSGHLKAAYAFHTASAIGLSVFLGNRARLDTGANHPGLRIAFAAALFSLAWTTFGWVSELIALPTILGRSAALAGLQGFALLFCMLCFRWNRVSGSPSVLMRTGTAVALLSLSLFWEAMSLWAQDSNLWLRLAYVLRAAWILLYLRRPDGHESLFADLPRYQSLIRFGSLFILAGPVLAAIFPDRSLLFNHISFLAGFGWIAVTAATAVIARRLDPERRRSGAWMAGAAGLALGAAVGIRRWPCLGPKPNTSCCRLPRPLPCYRF